MDNKPADAALRRAIGMLEAILSRQIVIHREMLTVADAKRASIISGDIALLEKSVSDERKLVDRVEEEEKKRQAVMPLVKTGIGARPNVEKLRDVIDLMPEPEKSRLSSIHAELKQVLEECQIKNRGNAELLKASLEHVETFMRSLNDALKKDVTYKRDGKKGGGGPSIIDRNA